MNELFEKMLTVAEFYKKITNWLLPLGYIEVFSNHPLSIDREYHFSKDGITVICVNASEQYCYVYKDILNSPYCLALRTGRYEIGTDDLKKLHEYVKLKADLL